MPDPERVIRTIRRATELFRSTPGRRGMVIELESAAEDVLVCGDLHGNLAQFQAILDRVRLDSQPARHLVLQELVHGQKRYSDGGCKSHQLVDVVAALKCQDPDRVHLILGNHERAELAGRVIIKNGQRQNELFIEGIAAAYGRRARDIYNAYLDLFRALPLAVRTGNRVFVSHSIPDERSLKRGFDPALFTAESIERLSLERNGPLFSLLWGRDVSESTARQFAELVAADLLITGHVSCPDGFCTPNPVQLVLDSSSFPACYCLFPNRAAVDLPRLIQGVRQL